MRLHLFGALFAAIFLSALPLTSASAQATRTWVSGVGDDANPCSRTAPCKTFAGAYSKTATGGEINCIDPGGFGGLNITHAIAIICDPLEAGVLVSGTNGLTVNAGVNDVVYLSGLDIEGLGTGVVGVQFNTGAALHVNNTTIRGFAAGTGAGISFNPTGTAELYVTNDSISENGTSTTGGGIYILPSGATSVAKAIITNTRVENNGLGIRADGSGSGTAGGVAVTVVNTTIVGNTNVGITSFSSSTGASTVVMLDGATIAHNGIGVKSDGSFANLLIGYSVVTGNTTGATIANGSTMNSYATNQISQNTNPGATIPTTSMK